MKKGRITGIGGVFFKCKDPNGVKDWYANHFGMTTDQYGALFESRISDQADQKTYLQWSPFASDTKYFDPSTNDYMINYRVENMVELVEELKSNGVEILDEIEEYEYGKSVHVLGPENQKIELWEPVDSEFTKLYEGKTNK